jgi:opacity protein-like surface antigen
MQPLEFDVNAGLALPMGDLGDVSKTGFDIGADAFLFTLDSMPQLKFGGRIAYNMFGEKEYNWGWGGKATSDASIIEIVPTVRYMLPSSGNMSFFGQAGIGLFLKSASVDTGAGSVDDSETDVGITVGGGAIFAAGGMKLFAMPLLHLTGDTYVNVNIGVLFGGK